MSDLEHARAMLRMAESDLNALQGMLHPSLFGKNFFSDAIFGFHAQQAVEKTLKAWISWSGKVYPRTHDLMALIDALEDAGESVEDLRHLVDLNPFAVQYRYETLDDDDDTIDRSQILLQIRSVYDRIHKLIGD